MSKCQLMRGFFSLRKCPDQSVAQCDSCDRAMCQHHKDADSATCIECAAKELTRTDDDAARRLLEANIDPELAGDPHRSKLRTGDRISSDPAVTMARRHRLYVDGDYQPFVAAGAVAAAYAAYDMRAFDADMRAEGDDLGEGGSVGGYLVDS